MSVHPLTPGGILVIEDESEVPSLAMDLLRVQGYTVLGMGAIRAPPFGWLARGPSPSISS